MQVSIKRRHSAGHTNQIFGVLLNFGHVEVKGVFKTSFSVAFDQFEASERLIRRFAVVGCNIANHIILVTKNCSQSSHWFVHFLYSERLVFKDHRFVKLKNILY